MSKRVLGSQKFYPVFLNVVKEKGLSDSESILLGLLYVECTVIRREGSYCGLSDENLGLKMPKVKKFDTVNRMVNSLKKKGCIIIESPQSGMRRIYINADIFTETIGESKEAEHSPVPSVNPVDEALKIENEELKKQIALLTKSLEQKEKQWEINFASQELIKSKLISKSQFTDNWEEINEIMMAFYRWLDGDLEQLKKCCFYWNEMKKGKINNPVPYLLKCIEDFKIARKYNLA